MFLSLCLLSPLLGFAQEGQGIVSEKISLQNLASQVEQKIQVKKENISPEEQVLQAVREGDILQLEALKYDNDLMPLFPVLRDEKGNNVFHLAKDENVVQFVAFVLRNTDTKTGGAEQIKTLLAQKNLAGQTPIFKALSDGKAGVFHMYSSFVELPKFLKKAANGEGMERTESWTKIEKHLCDNNGVSLLKAAENALSAQEKNPQADNALLDSLKNEIRFLRTYAQNLSI